MVHADGSEEDSPNSSSDEEIPHLRGHRVEEEDEYEYGSSYDDEGSEGDDSVL